MRMVWNMKRTLRGVSRRAIRGMPPMGTVDRHIVCAGDFAAGRALPRWSMRLDDVMDGLCSTRRWLGLEDDAGGDAAGLDVGDRLVDLRRAAGPRA